MCARFDIVLYKRVARRHRRARPPFALIAVVVVVPFRSLPYSAFAAAPAAATRRLFLGCSLSASLLRPLRRRDKALVGVEVLRVNLVVVGLLDRRCRRRVKVGIVFVFFVRVVAVAALERAGSVSAA